MTLKDRDAITGKCAIRFEAAERDLFWEVLANYPMQKEPLKTKTNSKVRAPIVKAIRKIQSENSEALVTFRRAGAMVIDKDFNEYWDLTIDSAERERLLQILNDVRVGIWMQLGCPEPDSETPPAAPVSVSESEMRSRMLLHICASWQMFLIHAFDS